ncbi:hypothetical protein O3P69_014255 [Scylla paramamosain]|uniref:Ionotropic glutamate receptor L-glutamate and glycine-binding domain-containing protein n=1 Tax=Scylla paramamosain TaxID=85552 RepID=A0AAW0TB90_SCYPA
MTQGAVLAQDISVAMRVKRKYPSQPISLSDRYKYVFMWLCGTSARSIARQHGVSPSTVCRCLASVVGTLYSVHCDSRVILILILLFLYFASEERQEWSVVGAVESVLTSHAPCQHACLLLADQHEELEVTQAPRGVRVLRAVGDSVNGSDGSHGRLRETVDGVREVLQDVPKWSTRILVLTRLPLSHLGGLHGLLSNRNAMLLRIQDHKTSRSVRRVGVFVWQPYSARGSTPLRVATWTPHGRLTLASHMSLFPDKFSVFSSAPRLKVVVELLPGHSLSWVDDAGEPGGRRLEYTGYISDVVKYFATRMNFTTTYVLSPERTFGSRMPDGSWTGMIGMVVRESPWRRCWGCSSPYSGFHPACPAGRFFAAIGRTTHQALSASSCSKDATYGEIREVAGLEKEGRLEFHRQAHYMESLDTLVRVGGHVLVDTENSLKKLIASDFTNKVSEGVFVLLVGCQIAALVVWCMELTCRR